MKELEKLSKLDDLNEEVHWHMIHCHLKSGNRAAAVNLYRELKRRLRQELGISPSADLQELYQSMLKMDHHQTSKEEDRPDLATTQHITWEQPQRSMLFYQSKTTTGIQMMNQALHQLTYTPDTLVLNICASPGKRIQYEGIYEIVDGLKKHYVETTSEAPLCHYEELDDLTFMSGLDQYQIFNRLTSLLSNLDREVVCIKVWNIHFMDERSIDFLSFLYRRYNGQRVVICGIYDENWHNQRYLHFKKAFLNETNAMFKEY